jgi:hypothetical protein
MKDGEEEEKKICCLYDDLDEILPPKKELLLPLRVDERFSSICFDVETARPLRKPMTPPDGMEQGQRERAMTDKIGQSLKI